MTAIDFNPSLVATDFTLPILPGMIIREQKYPAVGSGLNPSYPADTTYTVEEAGRQSELASKGFTRLDGTELPPKSRTRRYWQVAAIIVIILGFGIVTAFAVKRRARKM